MNEGNTPDPKNDAPAPRSEQVFDVTPDLKIAPVSTDSPIPLQYEDSKFKNKVVDPLDKNIRDIGGGISAPPAQNIPVKPPEPSSTVPPFSPIPSPVPDIRLPKVEDFSTTAASESINNPIKKPFVSIINPLRTYEGDIASIITQKGTSTAEMAMAEKRRETGKDSIISNAEPSNTGKKLFMALFSLILIGAGVIGAYYLYSKSPLAPGPSQSQQQKIISLVPSDSQTTVAVDGLSANQMLALLTGKIAAPEPLNSISEIIPYTTTAQVKNRVTSLEMVSILDIPAPDILVRSLTPSWMLGVYTDSTGRKNVFVVVTDNFFQNAFAGMLSWEKVMPDDLKQYLNPVAPRGIANTIGQSLATTTASSTRSLASTTTSPIITAERLVSPYYTMNGRFEDKIVKNKDVREFVTDEGKTLFLYSFVDNERLVIAPNEGTLAEIITRLEKEVFVR